MLSNPPRIHSLATRRQAIYTALNDDALGWTQLASLVAELRRLEADMTSEYAQVRRERLGEKGRVGV